MFRKILVLSVLGLSAVLWIKKYYEQFTSEIKAVQCTAKFDYLIYAYLSKMFLKPLNILFLAVTGFS